MQTTNAQPEDTPTETKAADSPVVGEISEETEKETQSEIKTDESTKVAYQPDGGYIVDTYDEKGNLIKEALYDSYRQL